MKDLLHQMRSRIQLPLHPSVPIVSKRLAMRLATLLLFSALPIPHGIGFAKMFMLLTSVNVATSVVMATFRHERFDTRALTHWDEALVMAVLYAVSIGCARPIRRSGRCTVPGRSQRKSAVRTAFPTPRRRGYAGLPERPLQRALGRGFAAETVGECSDSTYCLPH